MNVLVPLAEGFEETEAVSIIDVLRRAGINAVTAHTAGNPVTGSHGIPVTADRPFTGLAFGDFDGIALPGGMPARQSRDYLVCPGASPARGARVRDLRGPHRARPRGGARGKEGYMLPGVRR